MNIDQLAELIRTPGNIELEDEIIQTYRVIRKNNPEKFMKSLVAFFLYLHRTDSRDAALAFVNRWNLAGYEWLLFASVLIEKGMLPWDKAVEIAPQFANFDRDLFLEQVASPKVRIVLAIEEMWRGKPGKPGEKPKKIIQNVNRWMELLFTKTPKPYTKQHLADAAKWWVDKRRTNLDGKNKSDPRSRGSANATAEDWKSYLMAVFGEESPEFTKDFKIAVRRQGRKILKTQQRANSDISTAKRAISVKT